LEDWVFSKLLVKKKEEGLFRKALKFIPGGIWGFSQERKGVIIVVLSPKGLGKLIGGFQGLKR